MSSVPLALDIALDQVAILRDDHEIPGPESSGKNNSCLRSSKHRKEGGIAAQPMPSML